LLIVGLETLDDLFDDGLLLVGVHPGQDNAGSSPHLQVLLVLAFLGRYRQHQQQQTEETHYLHSK